ncbi:MAG: hypothetical protein V4733_03665 [Verrucomicrobiota bacterium]
MLTTQTSIRFSAANAEALERISASSHVSVNRLISIAIERLIEDVRKNDGLLPVVPADLSDIDAEPSDPVA